MEGTRKLFSPDNLSFGLVLGLAFFIPVFFLPLLGFSFDTGKVFLASVISLLALVFWLSGRLVDGVIRLPRSLMIGSMFLVAVSFLVSALFSPSPKVSLFGQGFEVGTFSFILIGAIISLIAALNIDSKERVVNVYLGLLASFAVIAVYQGIRLFVDPQTLSFGFFTDKVSNLVGKWNDLGIFFGLIATLSLVAVEIMRLSRRNLFLLYATLAISIFFLAVINFAIAWGVLTAISLVVLIYSVYLNKFEEKTSFGEEGFSGKSARKVPSASIAMLLVSVMFLISSTTIGGYLSSTFKTAQLEVRPSWGTTVDVARSVITENPVLGSGPNRFSSSWLIYKPEALNSTIFWATDFNYGVGLIPTFVVTTGALGTAAWLLFFVVFLYRGVKATTSLFGSDRASQFLVFSSFLGALYLWLFAILYVPGAAIMALTFLLTGVFVAALSVEKLSGTLEFSLLSNPKIGFISVLALVFLIVSSAAFGYLVLGRAFSLANFKKSLESINVKGDIGSAENYLSKAASISESDVYYRGMSQLALARINELLSKKDISQEEARAQFTNFMGAAIQSAKQAIDYDRTNYANWMNIGGVYEAVVPLGISGAYDEALKSYNKALEVAPKNPFIFYSMARLEVANKKTKAAREYLNKALDLKNDYTDALFFLSQIEASEGNLSGAIARTEQATLLAPDNVGLFFQLGLLKYNAKDYKGAIAALERATSLTPDYANAMYFLGLSYARAGREENAIKQFTRVSELNPDNEEIKSILKNLKGGKDPFAGISPPNNAPEKKKTPPIDESGRSDDL